MHEHCPILSIILLLYLQTSCHINKYCKAGKMSGFTQHSSEIDPRLVAHHLHPFRGPSTPAHPAGMAHISMRLHDRESHKTDFSCETVNGCSDDLRIRKVPENAGIFIHHICFLSTEIIAIQFIVFYVHAAFSFILS